MIRNLILPAIYIFCLSLSLNAKGSKTVNIDAGGLSKALTIEECANVTNLKVFFESWNLLKR